MKINLALWLCIVIQRLGVPGDDSGRLHCRDEVSSGVRTEYSLGEG